MSRERRIQAVLLFPTVGTNSDAILNPWLISGNRDGLDVSVRDSARAPALLKRRITVDRLGNVPNLSDLE